MASVKRGNSSKAVSAMLPQTFLNRLFPVFPVHLGINIIKQLLCVGLPEYYFKNVATNLNLNGFTPDMLKVVSYPDNRNYLEHTLIFFGIISKALSYYSVILS